MAAHDAKAVPEKVTSGAKDPAVAAWLGTGPVLGAPKPVHEGRHEHDAFVGADPPPVGRAEQMGFPGPHGAVPVRVYHPSQPAGGRSPALVYLHGRSSARHPGPRPPSPF